MTEHAEGTTSGGWAPGELVPASLVLVQAGDPSPTIYRRDDGTLRIKWPAGPRPLHVAITPEVLEGMVAQINELELARAPWWRRWAAR